MPRSDATDEVGAAVEVLDGDLAHHRELALQLCQILSAEHLVGRSGTPGHDPEILTDSPFGRLYVKIKKYKGGMT